MKKAILVISIIIITLFSFCAVGTLSAARWDLQRVFSPAVNQSYDIDDEFNDIFISVDTADVRFLKSEDGKCRVECVEGYKITHTASVKDGTLKIERRDERKWYELITIIPVHFEVTVYLPEGEWGKLNIKTSTGDTEIARDFGFASIDIGQSTGNIALSCQSGGNINLKTSTGNIAVNDTSADSVKIRVSTGNLAIAGLTASSLEISSSTGNIALSDSKIIGNITATSSTGKQTFTNVECNNLNMESDSGDSILTSVIAIDSFNIEKSTGDVKLDSSDATEIYIETDTGDVSGTLLSDKVFIVRTDTGDIDVPKSTVGGRCEIETDTGNVIISVK